MNREQTRVRDQAEATGMADERETVGQTPQDHTIRNALTVGLFAGSMVGFYIAMLLDVFGYNGDDSATDWVMAITAVAAAFISGLAVVLVAQTLNATRETLDVTRDMAEMQTRPWVFYQESDIETYALGYIEVIVSLKNYGNTPAKNVQSTCRMFAIQPPYKFVDIESVQTDIKYLPPGSAMVTSTTGAKIKEGHNILVHLSWSYEVNKSKHDECDIILIVRNINGNLAAEPMNRYDYKLMDEIFMVDSKKWINSRIYQDEGNDQ